MNKYFKIGVACAVPLAVLAAILLIMPQNNGLVPKGSVVKGIDIGGMTREAAVAAIENTTINPAAAAWIDVGDEHIMFAAGEVGARYDAGQTVDEILKSRRNIIQNIFPSKKVYNMAVTLDDAMLDASLAQKLGGKEKPETDISYTVSENGISITNGTSGYRLDRAKAGKALCSGFANPGSEAVKLELEKIPAPDVDIDAFLQKFESTAAEAAYVRNADGTIGVTEEQIGVTLDKAGAKSVMEAHRQEGETYNLPAETVMPQFTKAQLEAALFADNLAEYSSSYSSSGQNRAANVTLAASKINGVVLLPGEVFSFNNTLGERTIENGYKTAHAYAAGEVVDQVGGGICQVSSTLYNSVLLANLKIDERRSHQMTVAYVPLGRDATVNWGTQDFKFSNNTAYPVKITALASGGQLTVGIVGTKPDKSISVKIETQTVSTSEPPVETQDDPTMSIGTTKTVKTGAKGYVVDAYRVVYSDGVEISREKLKRSNYNPTKTIKKVGTMQPTPPQPQQETTEPAA